MTLVWILIAILFVCAIAAAGALRIAVKWGHEAIELQRYGVEATGTVIEKRRYRSSRRAGTQIQYEYIDQFGKKHRSRRNIAGDDAYESHGEGGPIAIVFSERRPSVSLPKYLIDLAPKGDPR